jgi:hypothetical protein
VRHHARVSALARLGLIILAFGLFADLVYHSLPLATEWLFGSEGVRAHLVVFFGMLLVTLGLIQQGLAADTRDSFPPRSASNAHR